MSGPPSRTGASRNRSQRGTAPMTRNSSPFNLAGTDNVVPIDALSSRAKANRIARPGARKHGWFRSVLLWLAILFTLTVLFPSGVAAWLHREQAAPVDAWLASKDAHTAIRVYRFETGSVVRIALNDYLIDVLAAEIRPNAPMAALQAAAVAARTYAIRATTKQPGTKPSFARQHGADVTDSPTLDLPWRTTAEQLTVFGQDYAADLARYQEAVESTDAQILTSGGRPIMAFTFALSPGRTRDARDVLGAYVPYLRSVACPDDRTANGLAITTTLGKAQVAAALKLAPDALDLARFRVAGRDAAGYVTRVAYGGQVWSGDAFASLLQLPSADFKLALDPSGESLHVTTLGKGTGLGLSLNEAAALAARGKDWQAILATFYPQTQIRGR